MSAGTRDVSYRRLARSLQGSLAVGDYDNGVRLPTEAELAAQYAVSRQTVRRAMQDLVAGGFVYRVAGKGTFAIDRSERYLRHFGSIEDLMSLSIDTECEVVTPLRRRVDVVAASRLQLTADDMWEVSFTRSHDGAAFCHTTVQLPPEVAKLIRDVPELCVAGARSRVTVIGLIDVRMQSVIREAEQSVTAVTAPAELAGYIGCAVGSPVLRIDRIYFDGKRRPLEVAVSHFDPQRYSYHVKLRRHPS